MGKSIHQVQKKILMILNRSIHHLTTQNKKRDFLNILAFTFLSIVFMSLVMTQLMDAMNVLIFSSLIVWFFTRNLSISKDQIVNLKKWYLVVFLGFFLLGLLPLVFLESSIDVWSQQFNKRIASLIAVVGFGFILIRLQPSESTLWKSVLAIALGIFVVSLLEYIEVGNKVLDSNYRFGGLYASGPLMFGVFTTLYLSLFFGGLFWSLKKNFFFLSFLFGLAILISLIASILTGTRGGWLGLPEIFIGWSIIFYLGFFKKKDQKPKFLIGFLSLFLSLVIFLSFLMGAGITDRFSLAIDNIVSYKNGNPNTSIGLRLLAYKAALMSITESPFTGVGPSAISKELEASTRKILDEDFNIKSKGFSSWDVHNQYLQEAYSRGLFGLAALLGLQLYLFVFFIRHASIQNIWASTGLIFMFSSSINMMSYSWLRFHDGLFFYFVITTLLVYGTLISDKESVNCE